MQSVRTQLVKMELVIMAESPACALSTSRFYSWKMDPASVLFPGCGTVRASSKVGVKRPRL